MIYIVEMFDEETNESFIKVGMTSKTVKQRYKSCPYKVTEIFSREVEHEIIAYGYEKLLESKFGFNKYRPLKDFGGKTECFSYDEDVIFQMIIKILDVEQELEALKNNNFNNQGFALNDFINKYWPYADNIELLIKIRGILAPISSRNDGNNPIDFRVRKLLTSRKTLLDAAAKKVLKVENNKKLK